MHAVASALSSIRLKHMTKCLFLCLMQLCSPIVACTVGISCQHVCLVTCSCTGNCIPSFLGCAAATGHVAEAVQGDFPLHLTHFCVLFVYMTICSLQVKPAAVALVVQSDPSSTQ